MARSLKIHRDHQIEALSKEVSEARYILLKSRLLPHDRGNGKTLCPCGCGSREAMQVDDLPDLDLLIDKATHRRWLRHEVEDKAKFDEIAAVPTTLHLDAPIRCYSAQMDAIMDTGPLLTMLTGGPRSGKSSGGIAAFFRRWMLWGGNQSLGFLMVPKLPKTRMLLKKFLLGEKSDRFNPPICPLHEGKPILATKWPANHRQEDQEIYMIDGSRIRLLHTQNLEADNLVGEAIFAGFWTECGQCKHVANLNELKARVTDTGGQVFLDTIPIRGHPFLIDEVIRPAEVEDELEKDGKREGRRLSKIYDLQTEANPWVPKQAAQDLAASIRDPILRKRFAGGQWIGDHNKLWENVWEPQRHVHHFADYGLPQGYNDVTLQACRPWWRRAEPWIIGVDLNKRPSTCLVAKVFGDPDRRETWGLYVLDVLRVYFGGSDPRKVARDLASFREGMYRGACIAIDPAADQKNQNKVFGYRSSVTPAEMFRREGFDCRGAFRSSSEKRHPPIVDSQNVLRELMSSDAAHKENGFPRFRVNGSRCPGLIHALDYQEDRGDGYPVKQSNAYSDVEIAGHTDALRYLAWPVFYPILFRPKPIVRRYH